MASFSNDTPTTPLRQRMQEDMAMRRLESHTSRRQTGPPAQGS